MLTVEQTKVSQNFLLTTILLFSSSRHLSHLLHCTQNGIISSAKNNFNEPSLRQFELQCALQGSYRLYPSLCLEIHTHLLVKFHTKFVIYKVILTFCKNSQSNHCKNVRSLTYDTILMCYQFLHSYKLRSHFKKYNIARIG